jgi:hypothetical protein
MLAAAALATLAPASPAWGAVEIADPCGPGTVSRSGIAPVWPEPQLPWLDACAYRIEGLAGDGPLRAVRTTIRLEGERAGGVEGYYSATLLTPNCAVHVRLRVYPGPQEPQTETSGNCGYRTEPCDFPESEVPNKYCGSYVGQFSLHDHPVVTAGVQDRTVTLAFDPNRFAAAALPEALAQDLGPRYGADPAQPPRYGSLRDAWIGASAHIGVRRVISTAGGLGESVESTGPVALD